MTSPKESHKSWKVEKFARADILELNRFLCEFPSIVVTSKSPELWHCSPFASAEENDDAGQQLIDPALSKPSDEEVSSDSSD